MGNQAVKSSAEFDEFSKSYYTFKMPDQKGNMIRVSYLDEFDAVLGRPDQMELSGGADQLASNMNHVRKTKKIKFTLLIKKTLSNKITHTASLDMANLQPDFQYDFNLRFFPEKKQYQVVSYPVKIFLRGKFSERFALMKYATDTEAKQLIVQAPFIYNVDVDSQGAAIHDRVTEFLTNHDDILLIQSIDTHCLDRAHMACLVGFQFQDHFVKESQETFAKGKDEQVRKNTIHIVVPPLPSKQKYPQIEYADEIIFTAGDIQVNDVKQGQRLAIRVSLFNGRRKQQTDSQIILYKEKKQVFKPQVLNITSTCDQIQIQVALPTLLSFQPKGTITMPMPKKLSNQSYSATLIGPKGQQVGKMTFNLNWPNSHSKLPQSGYHYVTFTKQIKKKMEKPNNVYFAATIPESTFEANQFVSEHRDQMDAFHVTTYAFAPLQKVSTSESNSSMFYKGFSSFATVFWKARLSPSEVSPSWNEAIEYQQNMEVDGDIPDIPKHQSNQQQQVQQTQTDSKAPPQFPYAE